MSTSMLSMLNLGLIFLSNLNTQSIKNIEKIKHTKIYISIEFKVCTQNILCDISSWGSDA